MQPFKVNCHYAFLNYEGCNDGDSSQAGKTEDQARNLHGCQPAL